SGASAAHLRRISWLRCSAATLVVEREFEKPLLMACDLGVPENKRVHPLPGSIGSRAVVAALGIDGVKINGKRREVWQSYATGGNLRSRTAALELIGSHDELGDVAPQVLTAALSAKEHGLVGTAAQVIAKHPERVRVETKKGVSTVDARVKKALLAALAKPGGDLEALSDVVQAVGALGLDDGKKRLLELCSSPHAVLRDKSHAALAQLLGGASKVRCKPQKPLPAPAELDHVVTKPITVELDSDAGKLTLELDPELAPIAVTRVADLVKSGFYNNMVVHRVVPAFVSQFGSPTADGYGGAPGKPALPCETSPISYRTGSVGVALAGRDTGGSQLFVLHVPTPHLDGKYALLGKGGGAWDALVDGDVIRKARIVE
ncbi:MAG TPA: peptidylprolyl isomerase, partial [Polyangiaceae bacterium]|nr:peptidylprolyl isomerase [Polyangiaceae bacterium]